MRGIKLPAAAQTGNARARFLIKMSLTISETRRLASMSARMESQ